MASEQRAGDQPPSVLDVVALLAERPAEGLARGQVGTVVEALDGGTVLVEFSDDEGRAYAITPCLQSELLVLRYEPQDA
jgi:Domain of unknown function (DUF4926)